jgi:uncharacterized RDD family membrane protein YckC
MLWNNDHKVEKTLYLKSRERKKMEDFKPFSFNDDDQEKELKDEESDGKVYPPFHNYVTASGGTRIVAHILDNIFIIIACIPIFIWLNQKLPVTRENTTDIYFSYLGYVAAAQFIMQFLLPLLTKGKTLGKACLHLRIINDYGGYASGGQLFFRSTVYTVIPFIELIPVIGQFVSLGMFIFWIISLVYIFKDDLNQSLQDKMAEVVVIDEYETTQHQNRKYEERTYEERNYD